MVWTSLFGIVTLVLLARALGFARAPVLAGAGDALRIAGDAIPDFKAIDADVAADGRAALVGGGDGRVALVRAFGDRWVVRIVNGAAVTANGGILRIAPAQAMVAPIAIDLGDAAKTWAARL